jgi:Icc-related predicted phosphoesterase
MTFKLFFTTDIHGSDRCFRKFINAAKFYGAQVLVLGGDITGKAVVPILKGSGDVYKANFSMAPRQVSIDELPALLKEIQFNGFYPFITTPDELASIQAEPQGIANLFRRLIAESLKGWVALAEERLALQNVSIYISPGNDDDAVVDEVLASSTFVINPEERIVEVAPGVPMLTLGLSNPTPWNSPREVSEEELGRRLNALAQRMPQDGLSIYNTHLPPKDTPIDQAARLDATLKPVVQGGQIVMTGVGSSSVREAILKYQPALGLHGHVHEAAGAIRLGKTICINPGSEYSDGILRGALITLDEKKKSLNYQLTMG